MWKEIVSALKAQVFTKFDLQSTHMTRSQEYVNAPDRLVTAPVTFWAHGLAGTEVVTFWFPKNKAAMVGTVSATTNFFSSGVTLTATDPVKTMVAYMPMLIVKDATAADCTVCYALGG